MSRLITVTVDRPLGSRHPEYNDMVYPVNYGYVEGIAAPDGEEQDAYIIGADVPLKSFSGRLTAIVRRADDVEEKWVICPEGMCFCRDEIEDMIRFQEQYYDSEIIMTEYEFDAILHEDKESGGAYVVFPYDLRKEFGRGRVKADVLFNGVPYTGSIVNMGVRDEQGNICYVIGVLKSIRRALGKGDGDSLHVVVRPKE